jgi:acetolactate synthase regulatory subunit
VATTRDTGERRTRRTYAVPTTVTLAPPAVSGVQVRLRLRTTGEPDTLPRVLNWLRRRGCALSRVDYAVDDRHGPGRFLVAVVVPPRHQHRLAAGLGGIVGVLDVAEDG